MKTKVLLLFFAPPAIYFLESFIFMAAPFKIMDATIPYIYPQLGSLSNYCSTSHCLYRPINAVAL